MADEKRALVSNRWRFMRSMGWSEKAVGAVLPNPDWAGRSEEKMQRPVRGRIEMLEKNGAETPS